MSVGQYDDFITAIQAVSDSLYDVDAAAFIAVRAALKEWAENTAIDATDILSRPNWLLSQYIGSKVVEYLDDRKVQAMVGFRFQQKENRFKTPSRKAHGEKGEYIPDPGYYGRFFEGGFRRGGVPYRTPDHFLRKAKQRNIADLQSVVESNFNATKQDVLMGKLDEIKKARRARNK